MGCDIHVHFECKINGKWEHYSSPEVNRWHAMFGKMAGVRRDDPAQIAEPKGLADDISGVVKLAAKKLGDDGHHHSWFNLDEIIALEKWCNKSHSECDEEEGDVFSAIFGYLYGEAITRKSKWPEGIEDVRMIFWFDN